MKKYFLFLFAALIASTIFLCSFVLHVSLNNDRQNGNIDTNAQKQINTLNTKLLLNLKNNNVTAVKQMMSKILIDSSRTSIDSMVKEINHNLSNTEFQVLNGFYINKPTTRFVNHVYKKSGSINDYEITYLALNKEIYITLLKPATQRSNIILLVCYGKYASGWKINMLYGGINSIFNKTAPDYYRDALNEYKKGNLINAVDMVSASQEISRPLGALFRYTIDDSIRNFRTRIINEANTFYHFPMTINIGSRPLIYRIAPQQLDDLQGIYPIVNYITKIPLQDSAALKTEKDSIQKVIGSIFKGIDTGNKYIIYHAFETAPEDNNKSLRYGFIERQK